MKDSFIGKKEIDDFLNTIDDNKESSLFKVGDQESKNTIGFKTIDDSLNSHKMFGLDSYRFFIVILFCLLNFSNGMQWVTFAPIASKFKNIYKVSSFHVDSFSMLYMVVYPFVTFPSSYIIDNKSMRLGIIISALLTGLGGFIKIFINDSMYWAYIGQALSAIAQPFILNSPGKIASTWFDEHKRVLITSICCLSNTIGILFGYTLPVLILDDGLTIDVYKEKMVTYLTIEAIISAACGIFVIVFFKSKPKIPPSNSQNDYHSPPLMVCLKMMLRNKSFLQLLLSFTCVLTYLNVYGTIINECFGKYNFADQQTSTIGVVANIMAICGSLVVSLIIDKLKNYKTVLMFLNFGGLTSHISLSIILETVTPNYSFVIMLLLWSICMISIIATYTSCMDLVVEITYPVGESISGGFIMMVNQITGIIFIVFTDYLMDNYSQRYLPNLLCGVLYIISLFGIFSMKPVLKRNEVDHMK